MRKCDGDAIEIDLDAIPLRVTQVKKYTVSAQAILSNHPKEWLNDAQIGNYLAMLQLPATCSIYICWPSSIEMAMERLSSGTSRKLQRALAAQKARQPMRYEAIIQDYVLRCHWFKVIVSLREKIVYCWEPYGSSRASSQVSSAFRDTFEPLEDGWSLVPIAVKFQTDAWNCGVWQIVVDKAFIAYCDTPNFGKGTFATFLVAWAGRMGRGVSDLNSVRLKSGSARRDLLARNEKFINEERERVRDELLAAAVDNRLPYAEGPQLDVFVEYEGEAAPKRLEQPPPGYSSDDEMEE